MKFFQPGIRDEWHFVIGKGAGDQQAFYKELERQLAPNIKALKVKSGYMKVGNFFNKKTMHFMKYGKYYSLTCAEAFGTELNISWYLYFSGAAVSHTANGFNLAVNDFFGHITGKTKDKIIGFASIGKMAAENATKSILSQVEQKEPEQSGNLVKT